jgi:hypothetical protein
MFRFIRLPLTLAGTRPGPGPASKTFYGLPAHLTTLYPDADHPPELRSELSLAYSRVHLLKPHAIILSYLDQKPLKSYLDHDAINNASMLYQNPNTPFTDLQRSEREVASIRLRHDQDLKRQIRRLHSFERPT